MAYRLDGLLVIEVILVVFLILFWEAEAASTQLPSSWLGGHPA